MDIWEAGKLYSRVRGWMMLAMLAFLVFSTMAYMVHDAIWPAATPSSSEKSK
jgi:hypothetical protein